MQPPLIAHIVYALDTGGLENGLVNIINRMPADEFRHMVICLTSSGKFARRIERSDVAVIELHKRPGHDLKTWLALWKVLREHRPDIVHSRNVAALEAQLVTLALPNVRRVHGEHGRDMNDLDGSNRKYNLFRSLLRPIIHHYIAVSQDLGQWLTQTIGVPEDKISQIYNGVDLSRFSSAGGAVDASVADLPATFREPGALVVGTVGRLTPVKDQQALIEAVALLRQQRGSLASQVRLMLVGGGPLRVTLEQQAQAAGIADITWFAGDRSDVASLLQSMDVFVLPSLAEGISNTLLEAMACALPVVATRVGGTPEIITANEQGLLVPAADPQELALALARVLNDGALRQRLGSSGRRKVEQYFNWEATVHRYGGIYRSLLTPSSHRVVERPS